MALPSDNESNISTVEKGNFVLSSDLTVSSNPAVDLAQRVYVYMFNVFACMHLLVGLIDHPIENDNKMHRLLDEVYAI